MVVFSWVGPKKNRQACGWRFFRDPWAELSRSLPPGGRGSRRSQRRTGGSWFRILPQNHLGAPEEGNHLAVGLIGDHCVPDLSRPAEVRRRCPAADRALTGGAEEVRLELYGGEAARAFRKAGEAAVATARVGERDHRCGVQVAVRCHHFFTHRHAAFYAFRVDRENFHAKVARQVAVAETFEVLV